MKTLILLVGTLVLNFASAGELTLYLIQPRLPMDWSSPRSLAITSGVNSAGKDYAPIGHFAVEISCARPNRYGINQVLTGMERKDKAESRRITLREGLGLGSLTYSFEGQLENARATRDEIASARRDQRLKIVHVPTTGARCDQMMEFLAMWIDAGSYTVYGGGKRTEVGEGAGCADFAMEFFKIASGANVPREWIASVAVPTELVGGNGHHVGFMQLLSRGRWAKTGESANEFKIPDTDKVHRWLDQHVGRRVEYRWGSPAAAMSPEHLRAFEFRYPVARPSNEIWKSIAIVR